MIVIIITKFIVIVPRLDGECLSEKSICTIIASLKYDYSLLKRFLYHFYSSLTKKILLSQFNICKI